MAPRSQCFTRRYALRLVGGALLAVPTALELRGADARRVWCRTDPVVTLDGYPASIFLSAALEDYELNNSSGDILVQHPKDAATNKVWEDPAGYFGQGVSTNFAVGAGMRKNRAARYMDIGVQCKIPAARPFEVLLEWMPGPIVWGPDGRPVYDPNRVTAAVVGSANGRWFGFRSILPYVK